MRRRPERGRGLNPTLIAIPIFVVAAIAAFFIFRATDSDEPTEPGTRDPSQVVEDVVRSDSTDVVPISASDVAIPVPATGAAPATEAVLGENDSGAESDADDSGDGDAESGDGDAESENDSSAPATESTGSSAEAEAVPKPTGTLTAGSTQAAYFEAHIVPFLRRHCTSCHGEEEQKGDLALHEFLTAESAEADREIWESVAKKLRAGEMPPKKRPRPPETDVANVVGWIDAVIFGKSEGDGVDPGRVTMRRLNNVEYDYTVQDLFGLDISPADNFPADDLGYGFDTIGDVLSIPPLLMEKYLRAAKDIVDAVWADEKAKARVLICEPSRKSRIKSCALKVLERVAERAFRRPVRSTELSKLLKLVDLAVKNDDGFEVGIQLALQAILSSSQFLFRAEVGGRPDSRGVVELGDYELASRLSYFLWSSMPDDELFALAAKNSLSRPEALEKQVLRMLGDEKAQRLAGTFGALWLGIRAMENVTPDLNAFPEFDEGLRRAMARETELFFDEVMRKDLSVLTFVDANFTYVNEQLAEHYGIPDVYGGEHRRVVLEGDSRGGVLTQGTVLTTTSNPTRTSPVKRGKWILEQILGSPPPPPPPGVDSISEEEAGSGEKSLRELMEKHRKDPNCAVCHDRMDVIGLAFENFDAVGSWREYDARVRIDPSGTLPDGRSFSGVKELKKIILEFYKGDFCRCLTEKMFTFALGRGLEYTDTDEVDRVASALARSDYRFSALVIEIVKSDLFRKKRGE